MLEMLLALDTSKATGPEGISAPMLKKPEKSITPSFTRLVQLSLFQSTIPKCRKQAIVLSSFRKGDKIDFGNYRPVSFLKIASKICKELIFQTSLILLKR